MASGFLAPLGVSWAAVMRRERLPVAVSYSTISRALGSAAEASTVVKLAPLRIQRAGPKDFVLRAPLVKMRWMFWWRSSAAWAGVRARRRRQRRRIWR